mmetsp:Transcript_104865/g.249653  ORF Transcript_104865/g.249653 Transcript_104865/m.249653 type:complete len:360 (-) Transcript_104865:1244-2323(-)
MHPHNHIWRTQIHICIQLQPTDGQHVDMYSQISPDPKLRKRKQSNIRVRELLADALPKQPEPARLRALFGGLGMHLLHIHVALEHDGALARLCQCVPDVQVPLLKEGPGELHGQVVLHLAPVQPLHLRKRVLENAVEPVGGPRPVVVVGGSLSEAAAERILLNLDAVAQSVDLVLLGLLLRRVPVLFHFPGLLRTELQRFDFRIAHRQLHWVPGGLAFEAEVKAGQADGRKPAHRILHHKEESARLLPVVHVWGWRPDHLASTFVFHRQVRIQHVLVWSYLMSTRLLYLGNMILGVPEQLKHLINLMRIGLRHLDFSTSDIQHLAFLDNIILAELRLLMRGQLLNQPAILFQGDDIVGA